MKRYLLVLIFLFTLSELSAQVADQDATELHCPDKVTVSAQHEKNFFCNSDSVSKIIIHSTLKQKGQSIVFPGSVNQYFWKTDGSGSITQHGLGAASYTIHPDDFKTGWVQFNLEFHLDPNIGCSHTVFNDTVMVYLMSFKADAGEDFSHCLDSKMPVEVSGLVFNDNNPGFSNLFTWTTTGTGSFANPYVENTSYSPSPEDISGGTVQLIFSVRKPQCKTDDFISDTVNVHFDICNNASNLKLPDDILIYPSPAINEVTFKVQDADTRELIILSSDGRVVLKEAITGTSTIHVEFPNGIYQAVIRSGNRVGTRNFIIQR